MLERRFGRYSDTRTHGLGLLSRAHSVHLALDSLNYTLLYVLSDSEMLLIHQAIGDMIPVIFSQPSILEHCIERNNTNYLDIDWRTGFPPDWQRPGHHGCIKKQGFEDGIPLWKFLSWAWWESAMHPLGKTWTVGPEDWGKFKFNEGNTYLGKSLQRYLTPGLTRVLRVLCRGQVSHCPVFRKEGASRDRTRQEGRLLHRSKDHGLAKPVGASRKKCVER
jgi:hypothetical protein